MPRLTKDFTKPDPALYWRFLIPCAVPNRSIGLKPEERGILHAVLIAYIEELPLAEGTYRQARRIAGRWWNGLAAGRKGPGG